MNALPEPRSGKILIAVGPSPNSSYLVTWAHRTALAFGWNWMAAHIDTGAKMNTADAERLEGHLSRARSLGAEVIVQEGRDIAAGVVSVAREKGATMVVVGRSGLSRAGILPRRPTVSDRIVRDADPIDVAVIRDAEMPAKGASFERFKSAVGSPLRESALLVSVFLLVSALGLFLRPYIGYRSIALVYLAAVLGLSFMLRPILVAVFAVLSALLLNFLFMDPRFTFRIATTEDLFLFVIYFLVAFVTGALVATLRSQDRMLRERERRNAFLLASTQRLSECRGAAEAARAAVDLVRRFFDTPCLFFLKAGGGFEAWDESGRIEKPDGSILADAAKAAEEGKICGAGSPVSSRSAFRCVPAVAGEGAAGVIAVKPAKGRPWKLADDNLLLALGRAFAFISERERTEEMKRGSALALESERLSKVLLDSVSHELRTPLTTITGSVSALRNEELAEDRGSRKALVDGALEAADRLNRIVEDILSISRIESGKIRLSRSLVDLADIANESIAAVRHLVDPERIRVYLPENARPARIDIGLVARLAANLLGNAARFAPAGSEIEFRLEEEGAELRISVRDRGRGVAEGELESIFDRFKRGRDADGAGLGLGLAICRGVAAAHGGRIRAMNAPGGGLLVEAALPGCVEEESA